MKRLRPLKSTWYYLLINCITESLRKSVGCFKDKIISLFKTNTHRPTVYGRGKKLNKWKAQKQSEENIFNNIRNIIKLIKVKRKLKIEELNIR